MPTLKSATITRASAAVATAALLASVPATAEAFSWKDLLNPRPVTAPVAEAVDPVTDVTPVTDVVDDTVDGVTGALDGATGSGDDDGCADLPVSQAFAKFGDTADYALAPGGNFETSAGWKLTGGAKIVSGNETLGVSPGSKSLKLPIGATATSPEFCVDETQPHFRFVSKPDNAIAGYDAIVLYKNTDGAVKQAQFTSSSAQSWGSGKWAPSSVSPLATKIPLLAGGKTASVQLLFVSTGNKTAVGVNFWGKLTGGNVGTVSIDSVMVDPYRRG